MRIKELFAGLTLTTSLSRKRTTAPFPAKELAHALSFARGFMEPMDLIYVSVNHGDYPRDISLAFIRGYFSESIHISVDGFDDDLTKELFAPMFALGMNPSEDCHAYFAEWKRGVDGEQQIIEVVAAAEQVLGQRFTGSFSASGPKLLREVLLSTGNFYAEDEYRYSLVPVPSSSAN
jgi:hypothetical protein